MMITEADVHRACDALNEQGIQPKHRLVREMLKTGSYTTITKYMLGWKPSPVTQPAAAPTPDTFSAAVQRLAGEAWSIAYATADAIASSKVADAAEQNAKLLSALEENTATTDEYAEENDGLRKTNEQLSVRLQRADEQIAAKEKSLVAAKTEVAVLRKALQQIKGPGPQGATSRHARKAKTSSTRRKGEMDEAASRGASARPDDSSLGP